MIPSMQKSLLAVFVVFVSIHCFGQKAAVTQPTQQPPQTINSQMHALYDSHQWFALREMVRQHADAPYVLSRCR